MKKISLVASFLLASLFTSCGDGTTISYNYYITAQEFADGEKGLIFKLQDDLELEIDPMGAGGIVGEGSSGAEYVDRSVEITLKNAEGLTYTANIVCSYIYYSLTTATSQTADLAAVIQDAADIEEIATICGVDYDEDGMAELTLSADISYSGEGVQFSLIASDGTEFSSSTGSVTVTLN